MDIIKIELEDFRQFYGKNELYFGNSDKNITIVLGANGNGKTSLFRAVMFAMYGDILLDQDNNTKEAPILVNLDKLEENFNNPVEAKVVLTFNHKDQLFVIQRSVKMIKEGKNNFSTSILPASLYTKISSGDFEQINEDVDMFMNEILHKDIREFFFFDSEKMELLNTTKSQKKLSTDVKNGIVKLLQIKSLTDSVEILKELISQETRKISNIARDSDIQQKEKEKRSLNNKIEELENENEILSENRELAMIEIEKNEKLLSSNEKIRQLQEQKKIEQKSLIENQEWYNDQKNLLHLTLKEAPNLLALDFLISRKIELQQIKDTQSDKIPYELIKLSLDNERCQLCSQEIVHDSTEFYRLEELKRSYSFSDITPIINGIQTTTQKLQFEEKNMINTMKNYLQKIIEREEEIEKKEISIRNIDETIKGKAELLENLNQIERNLSYHRLKIDEFKDDINRNELEIKMTDKKIEKLELEMTKLLKKYKDLRVDSKVVDKLKNMKEILSNISMVYTAEIIDKLSVEMTDIFRSLLSKKDKGMIDRVVINDKYEISVFDKMGNNIVRELSMGQGQIFTLSFITSLAKLASKGRKEVNFPLFMDTPFGRISGENRDNLIQQIPYMTNQWILLLTDTELTRVEQEAFDRYKKVGKVYELINEDRRTTITDKSNLNELNVRG